MYWPISGQITQQKLLKRAFYEIVLALKYLRTYLCHDERTTLSSDCSGMSERQSLPVDLRELPAAEQEVAAGRWRESAQRPFTLRVRCYE